MTASKILHPILCRLEYLTPDGWIISMRVISLLYPQRYVDRLREHDKFGRCTVLDAKLQPTGRVYAPTDLPADPSVLVKAMDGSPIPKLPDPSLTCPICGDEHHRPYDGSCLL